MAGEFLVVGKNSGRTFKLGKQIGEGTWGSIYKAKENNVTYAIKFPKQGTDEKEHKRFLVKEATIQTEVQHPNITPVVLFDTCEDDSYASGDSPFLVLPLAPTDLFSYILDTGIPSLGEAYTMSEQLADALDTLHQNNIIYSDIKPQNILIYRDPQRKISGKLSDFGGAVHITRDGTMRRGEYPNLTHLYKAPETELYKTTTPEHDQYGWAAGIVYPAFTGTPLFYFGIDGHRRPFPAFERLIPKKMTLLHEPIESVARRALKKNPTQRYDSMAELLEDLRYKKGKAETKLAKQTAYII